MKNLTTFAFALILGALNVLAADVPWYQQTTKPTTLKAVLAADQKRLCPNNLGFKMSGDAQTCEALNDVQLACDYITRGTLSLFLTVNGKGLFPAKGGTNPYSKEVIPGLPDDHYIGQMIQNQMLRAAIKRNSNLFKNGDLTVAALKNWK